MRRFKFCILLVFLSVCAATIRSEECETARFAVRGEYLYFQPIFTNDFIASPNVNGEFPFNLQPGGPGKKNKFDYASGFRLQALYFFRQHCFLQDVSLGLSYLPASNSKKIGLNSFFSQIAPSSGSIPQPEIPGLIKARHNLTYYAADLLATFSVFTRPRLTFSVQPGIHYAYMEYLTRISFSANTGAIVNKGKVRENSRTRGLGPQLGFKLDYSFSNRWALKSTIKGGLLLSKATACFKHRASRVEESALSALSRHPEEESWGFFPFWQAKLGLNFSLPISYAGYAVDLEIGYEYLSYPDYISRTLFSGNASSSSANPKSLFSKFDFQGPYLALQVNF